MIRSEVRNLVIDTTGRSDKTDLINSAINIALAKVSSAHNWTDLETEGSVTLVVDALSASLASGTRRVSEVRVIDGLNSRQLLIRPKNWIVDRWPDVSSMASSKPIYGYIQGETLFFAPPTDSAYVVKYTYFPQHADIDDDATTLSIPQADEAVIAYTSYWIFKSIEKHQDAINWLAEYKELLTEAIKVDRSSVVNYQADERGSRTPVNDNYWLDPFIRTNP